MTVLVAGMRALGVNAESAAHGILTDQPGVLNTKVLHALLDTRTQWTPLGEDERIFAGHDRESGAARGTATRADLVFASNSQLRALAELYAQDDMAQRFVVDFVAAWTKVMQADRFDLA